MSEEKNQAVELAEIREQLKDMTMVLASLSEANGCALDALLALLTPLASRGLLYQEEARPFMEAVKRQHKELHELNAVIDRLAKGTRIEP